MFDWLPWKKKKVVDVPKPELQVAGKSLTETVKPTVDALKEAEKEEIRQERLRRMMDSTKPINRNFNAPTEPIYHQSAVVRPSQKEEVRRNYESYSRQLEEDNNRRRRDDYDITDLAVDVGIGLAISSIFSDSDSGSSSSSDSGNSGSDWSGDEGSFSGGGSSGEW
jgi:uncharacterized membrane protein YgcG